jgi:hypothetical protein
MVLRFDPKYFSINRAGERFGEWALRGAEGERLERGGEQVRTGLSLV